MDGLLKLLSSLLPQPAQASTELQDPRQPIDINKLKFTDNGYQPNKGTQNSLPSAPTPNPNVDSMNSMQRSIAPSDADLAAKITAGYRSYNGGQPVPMESLIPQMVEAAKKYPVFQKNPFLIPAISIVETSAGKNWQLNHNPVSWAARVQQAGDYNPSSDAQSLSDMISAVGGDPNRGAGYDPETARSRMSSEAPYQKFRDNNNIQDFATTYESPDNKAYYPALMRALQYFSQ